MDNGLYSGVASMRANEKHLEAIAANLANLNTPAYKRLGSVTQAFDVGSGDRKHQEVATRHSIDFTQGVLERNDNPWSLALEGDGFFAVETPGGEAFTRNGSFHVDDKGELLTNEGFPVAWEGARGRLAPVDLPITVDGSGVVKQGANQVGRLKLADFADKQRLELDSEGYYHAPQAAASATPNAVVHQGAVERSNASSVDELVSMIKAQRGFESAASLMRSIDQSYRRLNAAR